MRGKKMKHKIYLQILSDRGPGHPYYHNHCDGTAFISDF